MRHVLRCYACGVKWTHTNVLVIYRSPDDVPLVIAGYECKPCGSVWLLSPHKRESME